MSGTAAILSRMSYDQELAARIRAALSFEPGITEQRMFGGCAFLLDGNMTAAASGGGGLMLRVDPAAGESLLQREGAQPFEMRGRGLSGWLRIDDTVLVDEAALRWWLDQALSFTRTLPAK